MQIESLETRAHEVLQLIASVRNFLRPVNRLPPEIFSYIAQAACQGAKDAESMILLTHVCRHWRDSIISTPKNWTSISSRSRSIATLSLERAKAAPLEINIGGYYTIHVSRLLGPLIPYVQNIQTLNVDGLTANELKVILLDFPWSVPNLRSLELTTYSMSERDPSIDPFKSFAPMLKHLTLISTPLCPSLLGFRAL